jgi:hypothetical protein
LAINPWLRQAVASKLRLNWAPEQIAGWLKRAHPDGGFYRVSHLLSGVVSFRLMFSTFYPSTLYYDISAHIPSTANPALISITSPFRGDLKCFRFLLSLFFRK